ncbi:uncharacterized protein CTRU02_215429 [Colletotrichum truncatum]|uniref:Uncharacterized protein n=1 Tax=Colletotrichum truncatum TaxID=5467 RepID=A0ACC3YCI3_COLTU
MIVYRASERKRKREGMSGKCTETGRHRCSILASLVNVISVA